MAEFQKIFNKKIKPIDIGKCDAVYFQYKSSDKEPVFRGIDLMKKNLKNYDIDLINHTDAPSIYSYYKINTMFSEIQGDIKHSVLYNKGESIFSKKTKIHKYKNLFFYKNETKHITSICKLLSDSIVHQALIFDGKEFPRPKKHDTSLSDFAEKILKSIKHKESFQELKKSLAHILNDFESKSLESLFKRPVSYWNGHPNTYLIAQCFTYLSFIEGTPKVYLDLMSRYGSLVPVKSESIKVSIRETTSLNL